MTTMTPPSIDNIIDHCHAFFDRPVSTWAYESFVAHFSLLSPPKLSVLNHRYIRTLESIESSRTESPERRRKARSLIDRHKALAEQRRRSKDAAEGGGPKTVVHGDVTITAGGDVITAEGSVRIDNRGRKTRKRGVGDDGGRKDGKRKRDGDITEQRREETVDSSPQIPSSPPLGPEPDYTDDLAPRHTPQDPPVPITPPANPFPTSSSSAPHSPASDPFSSLPFPHPPEFITTFLSMRHKHTFTTTGKILEDHIYTCVRRSSADLTGNPILRWIIDTDNKTVGSWFTKREKKELESWGPALPERDAAFEYAVSRFPERPTTADELWNIIESPSRPHGVAYSRAQHSTATYVNSAAGAILSALESYHTCPMLGPEALHEGWFISNIWAPLLDRCLHGVPKLFVSRTEVKARGSSNMRFDALVRAQLSDDRVLEFGAVEVARVAAATAGRKEEMDGGKLVRGLRDMLTAISEFVEGDTDTLAKVQAVGVQQVGWKMSVWTMHLLGSGEVGVLRRGRGRVVPMEVEEFWGLGEVMRSVVRLRGIVVRSMKAVGDWQREWSKGGEDVL